MSIESGDIAIDADAIVTAPREPAHDDDHSQPGVLALLDAHCCWAMSRARSCAMPQAQDSAGS
ncbi:MAG: hypothetical protein IPM07_04400 [Anaerolineales bacterium]|nr:hypothetical protein [Anaerolineales bacterium]